MPINDPEKSENMRKSIRVYSGSSNRPLAQKIAEYLGVELSGLTLKPVSYTHLQRRHLGSLALDDDVFVSRLTKARARIDADAVARHAGMDERAGLVGQKAHDAAHDGRRIGQGEAAELRGGHVGFLAAGAAAHHGGQSVIGLRCCLLYTSRCV